MAKIMNPIPLETRYHMHTYHLSHAFCATTSTTLALVPPATSYYRTCFEQVRWVNQSKIPLQQYLVSLCSDITQMQVGRLARWQEPKSISDLQVWNIFDVMILISEAFCKGPAPPWHLLFICAQKASWWSIHSIFLVECRPGDERFENT